MGDDSTRTSKKCVLEVFLKYDGFPQKWAMRHVREDGSTFELLESSSPIEVRPYGAGTAHEPPAEPTSEEVREYAYRLKMWRLGDEMLPIQLAEIMRKQIETAWSLRASQPPAPAHLGRGDVVRIGPNIRGEYSETMTITHVTYTLNHGAATVPDDAVVKATQPPGCNQCPHAIGDTYQRDCAYPDCSPKPLTGPGSLLREQLDEMHSSTTKRVEQP